LIDFRYHIVSIVAVFLALALGLFLGSTTLQSTVTDNLHSQADRVTKANQKLTSQRNQLSGQVKQLQGFGNSVEPYAVSGRLTGTTVAVVSAPGVNGGDRGRLIQTLTEAGASVTADVRISQAYLDATQDVELGNLARQLAGARKLPKGNGAAEASFVLAHALLAKPTTTLPTQARVGIVLDTLSAGKMLSLASGVPTHLANLSVLLVPGPGSDQPTTADTQQDAVLTDLAQALRTAGTATVVAGPSIQPGQPQGPLDAARADSALTRVASTVDADDSSAGRIAVVLALAGAPAGTVGNYGFGSGASPLPVATTTP
jgi:hypothetical protein